ncbi:nose resistant to fluoxetine protein 6-like [Dermacentor albipictus]|uniref:nose resistant to fluoxetine protein 6-like n=1 Tax=Dermacentor albipictus TaxID=60249 RepID=UPI0038FCC919
MAVTPETLSSWWAAALRSSDLGLQTWEVQQDPPAGSSNRTLFCGPREWLPDLERPRDLDLERLLDLDREQLDLERLLERERLLDVLADDVMASLLGRESCRGGDGPTKPSGARFLNIQTTPGAGDNLPVFLRELRLTGPPVFLVLVSFVYPALMNGPVADHIREDMFLKPCQSSWWTPLAHVTNIQRIKKMIYLACFGFIMLMKRKALIGGVCLAVLSAAATVAVAAQVYSYRYGAFMFMRSLQMENTADHIRLVYMLPHQHFVSFVVGVFGAYVFVNKKLWSTTRVRVAVLWVVAVAITTLVCLFPYAWDSAAIPYDPALAALYACLYPLLWSVSVTWMLHSCITGTADLVNRFLSMGPFMPLGKLSFSLYLVHPYVLYTKLITTRQFRALDQWTMFTDAIGLLFFSLFFAFVFYIMCECPITNIDKIAVDAMLKGRRREVKKEVPPSNVHSNNIELFGCKSTSP